MGRATVVIVGASHAGLGVANELLKTDSDKVKVILINPSEKHYFNIAAPRIFAKPQFFQPEQYLLPIEQSFTRYPEGSFQFVKGEATSINIASKSVKVSSLQSVLVYDYLVIASGSTTTSSLQGELAPFKPLSNQDIDASIRSIQRSSPMQKVLFSVEQVRLVSNLLASLQRLLKPNRVLRSLSFRRRNMSCLC